MQGWIKLHRKITENEIWKHKPFSRGQAWIDLLLMANHDDNTFLFDGRFIEVEKGSFITSEVKLMDRWGWSKSKTRLFLEELQKHQMLVKKTDHKKTTLTICKYCDYQISETAEEPVKDFRKTSERLQKDTNKNDKECKRMIKKDIYKDLPVELQQPLADFIEMRTKIKKPLTDRATQMILDKLDDLSNGDITTKVKILQQSTMNCWQGVFELKEKKNGIRNDRDRSGMGDSGTNIYDYEKFFE